MWGNSTPPTHAIADPFTIDLVCINRDFDKNHKKNQSLTDIAKISFLPYKDFITDGEKNLNNEYIEKLT